MTTTKQQTTCCKCQQPISGYAERYTYKDPDDPRRICHSCLGVLLVSVLNLSRAALLVDMQIEALNEPKEAA
jgi:hypothetical protein